MAQGLHARLRPCACALPRGVRIGAVVGASGGSESDIHSLIRTPCHDPSERRCMRDHCDSAFWSFEETRHEIEVSLSGIAEACRRPRHGGIGIASAQPLGKCFNRAVFEDPGGRVIEPWRLDDGNRKRHGDDLRSLDRPERSARNTNVDMFGCKPGRQLLRLLSSALGQRRSRRRRVGTDEPFGVVFTLGVPCEDQAAHGSGGSHERGPYAIPPRSRDREQPWRRSPTPKE
jgi:hypothetical protein